LAARCGLGLEEAEAATGALLSVLKKSKNLEDFPKVVEGIHGMETLKKYERQAFRKKLPNPAMMLLPRPDFAPPGPPPTVILKAAATGIKKSQRRDKDAGHTQDVITELTKSGIERDSILTFIPVFIAYVQEKTGTDVSNILCLPPDKEAEKDGKKASSTEEG